MIIFKSTKHLEASEKLYLWLTNPESSERITELYRTLWMPVQTEYYTDPDKIDFWASEELPARPEGFQDAIVKATYDHADGLRGMKKAVERRQASAHRRQWKMLLNLAHCSTNSAWLLWSSCFADGERETSERGRRLEPYHEGE